MAPQGGTTETDISSQFVKGDERENEHLRGRFGFEKICYWYSIDFPAGGCQGGDGLGFAVQGDILGGGGEMQIPL